MVFLKMPEASDTHALFLMTYANYDYADDWSEAKERIASYLKEYGINFIRFIKKEIESYLFCVTKKLYYHLL